MEIDPEALSRPDSHALTSASQRQRDVNLRKNRRPIQSRDRQVRRGVPTESDIREVSQKRRRSETVVSAILMAVAVLLGGCDGKRTPDSPPAPLVTVSRPLQKRITEWDEYTGRFAAVATVEVRPRVSGFIESIHFKDGDIVKQNDLLFTIDQRPYQFAVSQARADLRRAQAKLELADLDYQRALPLLGNQTMTQREFDTRRSTQKDAAASVESADAILQQAQLNLEWTEVRAPIAGRISDRRVDAGNLVVGGSGGTTLLTTIVSVPSTSSSTAAKRTSCTICGSQRLERGLRHVTHPIRSRCGCRTRMISSTKATWTSWITLSAQRPARCVPVLFCPTRMEC
jgi:multidrug efflux pump subunit AcrA (membrane-fusion protein)